MNSTLSGDTYVAAVQYIKRPALYDIPLDANVTEDMKGPLILFSGGLDSTSLVYERLKTTNVHLLYIVGNLNDDKMREELKARDNIKAWLKTNPHSKYRILTDTVMQFVVGDQERTMNFINSPQPLTWLFPALYFYRRDIHTSVEIGYVEGDHAIQNLDRLRTIWKNMTEIAKYGFIPLEFPISTRTKKDLYSTIPKELSDRIWVCDMPLIDAQRNVVKCNRCGNCKRQSTYLPQLGE